jgi:acylphosphatase
MTRIYGKVQGVNYRSSMQDEAFRIGLSGWVRNRRDGTVEALLCGTHEAIELMLDWARIGPPLSRVDKMEVTDAPEYPLGDFEVLADA